MWDWELPENDPYTWDEGFDSGGEMFSGGSPDWLENILQGEGGGTGDYSGVNLGNASSLLNLLQNSGGSSGGAGGSSGSLLDILKALGLTTGNNGSLGALLPLLSLFAGGAGLMNQNNNTEDAAKQLQAGADKANALATDLIGGARTDYKPYMDAGVSSLGKLQAMVGANDLAGKFGAIGQPSAMADKFKGAMTLKQLMGK